MTQARDYPSTTSTLSKDNFVIDDGKQTIKNGIGNIQKLYHFKIGSCILLNEKESTIVDRNTLREITYLRLDKINKSILDLYPLLKKRLSQHNVTQIQEKINNNTYLGYNDVFKKSFYTEEEHSHEFKTISLSTIVRTNVVNQLPSLGSSARSSINIPNTRINFDWIFKMNGNISSGLSINLIEGDTTKPNSYATNLYLIANVEWL